MHAFPVRHGTPAGGPCHRSRRERGYRNKTSYLNSVEQQLLATTSSCAPERSRDSRTSRDRTEFESAADTASKEQQVPGAGGSSIGSLRQKHFLSAVCRYPRSYPISYLGPLGTGSSAFSHYGRHDDARCAALDSDKKIGVVHVQGSKEVAARILDRAARPYCAEWLRRGRGASSDLTQDWLPQNAHA
jgi:hypothetical protein